MSRNRDRWDRNVDGDAEDARGECNGKSFHQHRRDSDRNGIEWNWDSGVGSRPGQIQEPKDQSDRWIPSQQDRSEVGGNGIGGVRQLRDIAGVTAGNGKSRGVLPRRPRQDMGQLNDQTPSEPELRAGQNGTRDRGRMMKIGGLDDTTRQVMRERTALVFGDRQRDEGSGPDQSKEHVGPLVNELDDDVRDELGNPESEFNWSDWHISEPGSLEGCRGARGGGDGEEQAFAGRGASRYLDKHGQSCRHILEAGPLEGCRGARGGGDGEEQACAGRGASRHLDKHGQSCSHISEPGPLEGCRGARGGGDGEEEVS
ncbi:hypothetical protein C8F04DRAFT_1245020 [Mycena alexandri]|uniref:Uncharacterized protein n=1 Tax=Mycena alexandri TaxID=1745969 RepID=A0AAD6S0A5_9AGAR|nr:hypothetical protein C8F04DRAFT_1245020 [Mycena alexandri]